MLPLWRNALQLLISPDGAEAFLRSPWGRTVDQQTLRFSQPDVSLEQRYAELTEWFDLHPQWHDCRCHVVLSHHWVNFLLQPWVSGLSRDDIHALATAAYLEQFGPEASDWVVRVDDAKPGHSALCAAISSGHLTQWQAMASRFNLKLRSLLPSVVAILNQHHASVAHGSIVFAICAGPRWQTVWLQEGQCRYVQTLVCAHGEEATALEAFVQRLAWQTNQTIDKVYCVSERASTNVVFNDARFENLPAQSLKTKNKATSQKTSAENLGNTGESRLVAWGECLR